MQTPGALRWLWSSSWRSDAPDVAGCNGDFLVLDLGHRTCAGNGTSCVSSIGLAFFVAIKVDWRLITYGKRFTCKWVRTFLHEPNLPDALCAQAISNEH